MKPINRVFIGAQLADIATTVVGVSWMGMMELNPLGFSLPVVALKLAATAGIVLVIEYRGFVSAWLLAVPIISLFAPVWNLLMIAAELLLG